MISYEAVESGARVLIEDGRYGVPWGDVSEDDRAEAMARVRAILEAAVPHMLAGTLQLADKWQLDFPYKAQELRAALGATK